MNEIKHEIIVKGTPKIENIPKEMLKIFCETILGEIEDYFHLQNKKIKQRYL